VVHCCALAGVAKNNAARAAAVKKGFFNFMGFPSAWMVAAGRGPDTRRGVMSPGCSPTDMADMENVEASATELSERCSANQHKVQQFTGLKIGRTLNQHVVLDSEIE
jgi:hypothetical protein